MDLTQLLWNCLTVTLGVALVCYLASFRQTLLLTLVFSLSLFAGIQFWTLPLPDTIETMGFIKLMFLLPLGLGSLLTFAALSQDRQAQWLAFFTRYINFAVTANIFIMLFTPAGDTWRGLVSRCVCLVLLVWLFQEMARRRFQTTHFDAGFFIFHASPLPWVLCHAFYRMALLSLPAFDSLRYLLLEPLSLATMYALYRLHQKRYPLAYYFGFADTIVVSTLAVLSRYPIPPPFVSRGPNLISLDQNQLDWAFIPIQLAVIVFALRAIRNNTLTKSA